MKLVIVSGARPQFIKLAPIIHALEQEQINLVHIHTGQHYDTNMSSLIFEDLEIPNTDYNLNIGSGTHGYQTGEMVKGIEKILMEEQPTYVLVPGDTNSTLAGALASVKLHIPVIHLEAGLRSHNWKMPEEINRILVDRVSSMLVTSTEEGRNNLLREGVNEEWIYLTGDTMVDALEFAMKKANRLGINPPFEKEKYFLATMHRAENVDTKENLELILRVLRDAPLPVVFPIHPRTKNNFKKFGMLEQLENEKNVHLMEPQGYLNFVNLLSNAKALLTDSGGLQKEAFIAGIPAITLRTTTEWVESIEMGANRLCGLRVDCILSALQDVLDGKFKVDKPHPYGDGNASKKIVKEIVNRHLNGKIVFPTK
ncbi:MAG: UDP-N-acetylglucosamine 2-epimerase (non-hydrolyzing) [Methanobacteriota archaeon]|nr:MAG: UDP-N-acetylglucosamine 2-epimerase (non-hydrolyzing) [Euryarchaeota archaeon]